MSNHRDRIFFVVWVGGKEVVKDMSNTVQGTRWGDLKKEIFTPEELAESELRVALIGELIKARREKGITQKMLGELSGVKQPVIARMENGSNTPNLSTVLKVLAPLGKTLYIGDR